MRSIWAPFSSMFLGCHHLLLLLPGRFYDDYNHITWIFFLGHMTIKTSIGLFRDDNNNAMVAMIVSPAVTSGYFYYNPESLLGEI